MDDRSFRELLRSSSGSIEAALEEHRTTRKDGVVGLEDETRTAFLEKGKTRINELVWCTVSPNTTVGHAEKIACEIFDMINRTWTDPA